MTLRSWPFCVSVGVGAGLVAAVLRDALGLNFIGGGALCLGLVLLFLGKR
jgi:hypothetical protein